MVFEHADRLAGLCVPDAQRLVSRGRNYTAPVGRYRHGTDQIDMAFERSDCLTALQVPEPQRSALSPRHGAASIGRNCYDPVQKGVVLGCLSRLTGGQIPNAQGVVAAGFVAGYGDGVAAIGHTEEMLISVGDQIRITEGFKEQGVAFRTNDIAKVKAVELDHIELEDRRRLNRDFVHLDQGVCITSYASECRTVRQVVAIAPLNSEMHAKTFYVLASRATRRAVFFTDCKEAFKEAVLRPGERVAVWDYENGAGPDSQKIAAQVEEEQRYAAAEARDEGTVFHAGEEDLQAFWNLQREAPDLQQIAAQAQHTMKPNQEREIGNERHY